jgi:hypothetical protein
MLTLVFMAQLEQRVDVGVFETTKTDLFLQEDSTQWK